MIMNNLLRRTKYRIAYTDSLTWNAELIADEPPFINIGKRNALLSRMFVLNILEDTLYVLHSAASPGIIGLDPLFSHVDNDAYPMVAIDMDGEKQFVKVKNIPSRDMP